MSSRRSTRSSGGLVATLAVGVLAITAVLLAVFALRVPSTQEAGKVPGPIPTWGQSSTSDASRPSTAAPMSTTAAAAPNPQFLSMYDATLGIRATAGSCTGAPAVVQQTSDGGVNWTTVIFDGIDVRQVLGLDYVSDTQISVVAAAADCAPTVVTSFTGGEFWQTYPDQIGTETFVEPSDPSRIRSVGEALSAPCAVEELQSAGQFLVVLCDDGTLQTRPASAPAWTPIKSAGVLAIAPSTMSTVLAAASDPSCAGTLIRNVDVASSTSNDLACLVADPTNATLDLASGSAYFWSTADFLSSKDGGVAWSPLG